MAFCMLYLLDICFKGVGENMGEFVAEGAVHWMDGD
jgi:hypothetical protein